MASPKIQIKRNTYVPPYTLSPGELALNTASKNLFVQTADGSRGTASTTSLVASGVVFTLTIIGSATGTGPSLIANYTIVTSGTTGYNARLFNIGTVLKFNTITTSEFYVTSVTDATTFTVRQVGNSTGTGEGAVTNGTLDNIYVYPNSMTWIGAQIDTSISGTGTYDRLVSQKGITDYVAGLTAGAVTLNEMGDSSVTYYPVFAESTGSSVYRDFTEIASGTVPSYNPSSNVLSAKIFSGAHVGTVGASSQTTGAFTTVTGTNITGTGLGKFLTLQSTETATGVAPLVVASSVNVANLNASSLNGQTFSSAGNAAFGTVSATGQITSTLAQGTAPFLVTSTTVVSNLNANLLNGATFAAPGAIGVTTPGTAAFTNLTTSGTTTINGNLLVNNTQTYLNTTVMQVTDKNIELGAATAVTSGDAYAASAFSNSSTTISVSAIATSGAFTCSDTTTAGTPQTLVVGQLVTISGTITSGTITGYTTGTTYKISATNGKTTFTLTALDGTALTTGAGTGSGLTLTMGLRPYFATQGTVAIVSSALLAAKITFSNTGLIPVGIRIGSIISGTGVGGLNVSGSVNTVTSITPTEIFYTYTSGSTTAPTANAITTLLAVTNDYTATVTLTGSTNSNHSTSRMGVGSTFACTGFTAVMATVTSITSNTVFTVSNRDAVVSSGTSAGNSLYADTLGLTVILIGGNSDTIANGGGFTVKGTTDKTLTWVKDGGRSWDATNGPQGYFSFNQPLQAYTSLGAATKNLSTLILTANNTDSAITKPLASIIEFETIWAGTSTKGYLGMTSDRTLYFNTSETSPANIVVTPSFSVTYDGKVGDCTIDCGQY